MGRFLFEKEQLTLPHVEVHDHAEHHIRSRAHHLSVGSDSRVGQSRCTTEAKAARAQAPEAVGQFLLSSTSPDRQQVISLGLRAARAQWCGILQRLEASPFECVPCWLAGHTFERLMSENCRILFRDQIF